MNSGITASDDPRRWISTLRYWARATEDHPFLTYRTLEGEVERYSYGDFYDRVRRLAGGLLENGLRPGDRCIVHTGNTPGFMLAFWALQEAGAVAIPTIVQYSADELNYVADHSGAWGVITTEELLPTATRAVDGLDCRLIVEGTSQPDVVSLEQLIATGRPTPSPASPDGLALILYTSGTTSRPKGVMLSQQGSLFTATSYAHHFRLTPEDTVLTCMPLFHVNGMFVQMAPAILSGSEFVLTPRFSASQYWEWAIDHDVTMMHQINGPIRLLLAAQPTAADRDHRVRGMTFGLPLLAEEIDEFQRRFGIPLLMLWGLTETSCGGTLMPIGPGFRYGQQHVGPQMHGWEVRIVDPDRSVPPDPRELEPGKVGEMVVRSGGVMRGYFNDPTATAAALQDGWVRSGDLGFRDEDGYFHFVDRIKDMLKPSGENVAASEIEGVISEHPAVEECAVIGIPDPIRTELVISLVVAKPGTAVREEEIREWCTERLARFKVPSIVEFHDELPKTSVGKIRKGELRQQLVRERSDG
jgi:carnitine-CoA ligase